MKRTTGVAVSGIARQDKIEIDAGGAEVRASTRFGTAAVSNQEMDQRASRNGRDAGGLRVSPLLFVAGQEGERLIVVGHVLVEADPASVSLEATIVAAWFEDGLINEFTPVSTEDAEQRREVQTRTADNLRTRFGLTAPDTDPTLTAAALAKSLAEASRNTVGTLREIRYALEECLTQSSKGTRASEEYTDIIAALLQLNIICGRGADQAREASREGLWVHTTDPEAYHAYRKLQDPALINEYSPATHLTRPWMRSHDAAMRQCQEMCRQLEKESESIRILLSAASSISTSREADAQARFNLLVTLLSIGLGIPALFLTLYGANLLLPLNTWPKVGAFVPVGIALLAAGIAAIWFAPRGSKRRIWLYCGVAVLLILVLMIVAAVMAPVSLA